MTSHINIYYCYAHIYLVHNIYGISPIFTGKTAAV